MQAFVAVQGFVEAGAADSNLRSEADRLCRKVRGFGMDR